MLTGTKDKPYTLIFSESPAGTAQDNPLDRYQELVSIAEAHQSMAPRIKAGFDSLHEGVRPFHTREMRIWKTNAFIFDRTGEDSVSGVFLDMSRINHSCVPNAEYNANLGKGRMELYSTRRIEGGEEVTISYGHQFLYKTEEERNSHLRYIYGFTCTCRACTDADFKAVSDRRRRALKEDFYCGMHGHTNAPDFSAKALDIEGPSSIRPGCSTQKIGDGFSNGIQISRPGTLELMRRSLKLKFDEGLRGEILLGSMFTYASATLIVMHKRMRERRSRMPVDPVTDLKRLILEEATIAEARETISEILSNEPDPFSGSAVYRG
ncbi:hypothetical protein BDZ45DRAFT_749947 [Acephala macrosclerotiorum]|nr:hypothetical protein BDZ45DRAFT_749947 [Acephala macrosclerotiorum]